MTNSHFEISGTDKNYTVTLKSANGKIISSNSGFDTKQNAYKNIIAHIDIVRSLLCLVKGKTKKNKDGTVYINYATLAGQEVTVSSMKVKDKTTK